MALKNKFAKFQKVGVHTKVFPVAGIDVLFRTLTQEEHSEALQNLTGSSDLARGINLTRQLIARSIKKIDNEDVTAEEVLEFFSGVQKVLYDEFAACYEILTKEQRELLSKEGITLENSEAKEKEIVKQIEEEVEKAEKE